MMSFQFEAAGEYSEGAYWGAAISARSAEAAGRERQVSAPTKMGCPLEDADPIPVARMFMASHPAEWLLALFLPARSRPGFRSGQSRPRLGVRGTC